MYRIKLYVVPFLLAIASTSANADSASALASELELHGISTSESKQIANTHTQSTETAANYYQHGTQELIIVPPKIIITPPDIRPPQHRHPIHNSPSYYDVPYKSRYLKENRVHSFCRNIAAAEKNSDKNYLIMRDCHEQVQYLDSIVIDEGYKPEYAYLMTQHDIYQFCLSSSKFYARSKDFKRYRTSCEKRAKRLPYFF